MKVLNTLFKKMMAIISRGQDPIVDREMALARRADNLPQVTVPPLPVVPVLKEIKSHLWYPLRVRDPRINNLQMKTRGYYVNHFPEGAVVHFTAGRSRDASMEGPRNALTNYEQGVRQALYACKETEFCYFLIDRDGDVFQQFPLDQWGYHAGKSLYPGLTDTVSNELVGIEVMAAGKLVPVDSNTFKAWYTDQSKGDKLFEKYEVETWEHEENIEKGSYHAFTPKQKDSLIRLLLWLKEQNPAFKLSYVVGHDEVAPERKNDPGGALGMTMSHFRELLIKTSKSK